MNSKTILFLPVLLIVSITACKKNIGAFADSKKKSATFEDLPDSVLLDYATAKRYVKNYEAHAGHVDTTGGNNITQGLPNTRSIWFSKERLQAMLNKVGSIDGDGIRFYFATYDAKYDPANKNNSLEKKHWGFNTLLMVSTKDSIAGTDTLHRDYYGTQIVSSAAASSKATSKVAIALSTNVENKGELCPPPRDCFSIGATLISN